MITFKIKIIETKDGVILEFNTPKARATQKEIDTGMRLKRWMAAFPIGKVTKHWGHLCQ